MSVQTKKRFKNLGKTIGVFLFVALMFTNIKIALMDDAEIANGDISVFGIELNLFEGTYAGYASATDSIWDLECDYGPTGNLTNTHCSTGGQYVCFCSPRNY